MLHNDQSSEPFRHIDTKVMTWVKTSGEKQIMQNTDHEDNQKQIFDQVYALIEIGDLSFIDGAGGKLNRLFDLQNDGNQGELMALVSKYRVAFEKQYQTQTIVLTVKEGLIGQLIVLCKCFLTTGDKQVQQTLESVTAEISQLKRDVGVDEEFLNIFPYSYDRFSEESIVDNQLSWNTGNLAMALLMFNLGRCLGSTFTEWAYRLVGFSMVQSIEKIENQVTDLFTGTSGIVLMYDFFFEVFGEDKFQQAAKYWREQTRILAQNHQESTMKTFNLESHAGVLLLR